MLMSQVCPYRIFTANSTFSFLEVEEVKAVAAKIGTSEEWSIEKWNGENYVPVSEEEFTRIMLS